MGVGMQAAMGFSEEQKMRMVVARAHLLARARLILQERQSIIQATQVITRNVSDMYEARIRIACCQVETKGSIEIHWPS